VLAMQKNSSMRSWFRRAPATLEGVGEKLEFPIPPRTPAKMNPASHVPKILSKKERKD